MINTRNLFNSIKKDNINFFTGVPDSVLKNFTKLLSNNHKNHLLATNEGSAISIGIGYHLSTKKIPCIYMQNSGLSNAINPLISIAHKGIYSIPMLLLVGWRGSPGINDEPQHKIKGKITLNLLKLLGIKYIILNKDKDLIKLKKLILYAKKNSCPVACLIKKSTLKKINKNEKIKHPISNIFRKDVIKLILQTIKKDTKIISTTGYTSRELYQIRKIENFKKGKDFYMVGGMGHSVSVALGCVINSNQQVFCLDGDGSVLMHLGALRTAGYLKNSNFKHIVLNNNSHESVGGQLTNAIDIDFKNFSKSIGYKNYFKISTHNYIKILKKFVKLKGPSLLEVIISNGALKNLSRPKNLIAIKDKFMIN